MQPDDRTRLRHMLEAAEQAVSFASGRRREDLDSDRMLFFALSRVVEIIGEAAVKLGEGTRSQLPEIPWPSVIAMRNRLVHAYYDINHAVLWKTVTEEVPELIRILRSILTA